MHPGPLLRAVRWAALVSIAFAGHARLCAAPAAPTVFHGAPQAQWIAPPGVPGDAYGVFHFRRVLPLASVPAKFVVHVSGDNRYRLFVNGRSVATGPQRSDLAHWRYETLDLAPYLKTGDNVLAAVVWNWGAYRPVAQFSRRTAFLVQADSPAESAANTGPGWKVLASAAYAPVPVTGINAYYAAPPGEGFSAAGHPWGWEQGGFDDRAWAQPVPALPAAAGRTELFGTHSHGEAGGWQLVARRLPPMEEAPVRFATVRRASGLAADPAPLLQGQADLVIPPHAKASLLLDQAQLTNAYFVLTASGGAGATINVVYAEALKDAKGAKGNRNEIEGKTIVGVHDTFRPDGGARRTWQTLWFRTYRYVQLDLETGAEPLRLHDVHGIFTAYPFTEKARFTSDLPWLADMWRMNWRVARLCAWETYFDTPYYEQLQYVGDTRIQSLISYAMTGDDRLAREAILPFDAARTPEGLTGSRYPSDLGQYIPPFSLIWVAMVHDYWMYRDDADFARSFLPGIRAVLGYYERHLDATGLVGEIPWWNFADWAPQWRSGIPPGGKTGRSTLITFLYVYALQHAAELEQSLGQAPEAARLRTLAEKVQAAVRAQAWDAQRKLFLDAPDTKAFSQQTNTLALLTGTVPAAERRSVMEQVLAGGDLVRASYYFQFYVHEALRQTGLGDRYIEQLAPWQEMLRLGLTTTPEQPDPTRSDSHAWSAHPNHGLLATVLGIRPGSPGFRAVRIEPHLGALKQASGEMPHPRGTVAVQLERRGDAGVRATVTLPAGVSGVFVWAGRETPLKPGPQQIER